MVTVFMTIQVFTNSPIFGVQYETSLEVSHKQHTHAHTSIHTDIHSHTHMHSHLMFIVLLVLYSWYDQQPIWCIRMCDVIVYRYPETSKLS